MGKEYSVKSIFCVEKNDRSFEYFLTYGEAESYTKNEPTHRAIFVKQVLDDKGTLYLFEEDLSTQLNKNIAARRYQNDMWASDAYTTPIVTEVFIKYGDTSGSYSPWEYHPTNQTKPILTLVRNEKATPITVGSIIKINLNFQLEKNSAQAVNETYTAYNIYSVTVEKKKSKFFAGTSTDFFCTEKEAQLFVKKLGAPIGQNQPYPKITPVIKKDDGLFIVEKGNLINNPPRNNLVAKDQVVRVFAEIDNEDGSVINYSLKPENYNISPIYIYNCDYKIYKCDVIADEPITINNSLMLEVETELRLEYERKIQEVIQQHIDMMDKLKPVEQYVAMAKK